MIEGLGVLEAAIGGFEAGISPLGRTVLAAFAESSEFGHFALVLTRLLIAGSDLTDILATHTSGQHRASTETLSTAAW